jgi:hypothetical protein
MSSESHVLALVQMDDTKMQIVTSVKVKLTDHNSCGKSSIMVIEPSFLDEKNDSSEIKRDCTIKVYCEKLRFCSVQISKQQDDDGFEDFFVEKLKVETLAIFSRAKEAVLRQGFALSTTVAWKFDVTCHYINDRARYYEKSLCCGMQQTVSYEGLFPTSTEFKLSQCSICSGCGYL